MIDTTVNKKLQALAEQQNSIAVSIHKHAEAINSNGQNIEQLARNVEMLISITHGQQVSLENMFRFIYEGLPPEEQKRISEEVNVPRSSIDNEDQKNDASN